MQASNLRDQNVGELQQSLEDLLKEQFNLRMQRGSGQLSRPHLMNQVKKDIARVKTVINQKKAGDAQ